MSTGTKVVVVGAGLMGTGIAHAYATTGHQVVLVDTSATQLEKAQASIGNIIGGGVKLGKMTEEAAKASLANLKTSGSLADSAKGANLLIETASERLDVKHAILREADPLMADDAIITTNTSALSITEIAAVTKNPKRVCGLHFFNPVHKMKLVEIIKGLETSDETVAYCHASVKAIGKTFITVNENPGFATSRMSAMMGNEAMYMVYEGVASPEDVDTAMRMAFNHPMGPLELGDLTGWDTRLAVLEYLHKVMGEKFRPCPLIHKLVKAGRYGRKVGKGVYEYNEKGEKIPGSSIRAH